MPSHCLAGRKGVVIELTSEEDDYDGEGHRSLQSEPRRKVKLPMA